MKVAICCIGKQENLYIREYVDYYKNLGVNHIFLYDNNDVDSEHFEDIIGSDIQEGYITLINLRGATCMQMPAYQHCYSTFGSDYDWIMFIDCDEFLELPNHKNINDFLSEKYFDVYDIIHINWLIYGDCDNVRYENIPLNKRFDTPIIPLDFNFAYNFPENNHIKSIIRGGISNLLWQGTPHTPYPNKFKCCDALGNEIKDSTEPFNPFNFDNAYFKHFTTKTIEEYINKINRGYPDQPRERAMKILNFDRFFKLNKKTQEKIDFIQNYIG